MRGWGKLATARGGRRSLRGRLQYVAARSEPSSSVFGENKRAGRGTEAGGGKGARKRAECATIYRLEKAEVAGSKMGSMPLFSYNLLANRSSNSFSSSPPLDQKQPQQHCNTVELRLRSSNTFLTPPHSPSSSRAPQRPSLSSSSLRHLPSPRRPPTSPVTIVEAPWLIAWL
jgi:hypothetical protein